MGRNWLVIYSKVLFVMDIIHCCIIPSISHFIMEQPPSHEEESDSDSAVKKFIEAKRAMHDDRCYDVVSNQQLRKELKLSKRQYEKGGKWVSPEDPPICVNLKRSTFGTG